VDLVDGPLIDVRELEEDIGSSEILSATVSRQSSFST
jgi:hypothetical protein